MEIVSSFLLVLPTRSGAEGRWREKGRRREIYVFFFDIWLFKEHKQNRRRPARYSPASKRLDVQLRCPRHTTPEDNVHSALSRGPARYFKYSYAVTNDSWWTVTLKIPEASSLESTADLESGDPKQLCISRLRLGKVPQHSPSWEPSATRPVSVLVR